MHCPKCGAEATQGARYCQSCGAVVTQVKTPTGLIVSTWILCVCTIIPLIGILCSIAMFVTSILLIRSRNRAGEINGIIALVLWIITFLIGFGIGFSSTYGR